MVHPERQDPGTADLGSSGFCAPHSVLRASRAAILQGVTAEVDPEDISSFHDR